MKSDILGCLWNFKNIFKKNVHVGICNSREGNLDKVTKRKLTQYQHSNK